jgi:hypothetical protein
MGRTKIDVSLINIVTSILNMGSNKITNLANGTAASDAAAFGQITAANAGALPLTGGTLSGNLSFTTTSTQGVVGTTTNNNAAAGNIGEYVSSYANATNMGSGGVVRDLTSISLTAGDWDVSIVADCLPSTTGCTDFAIGASITPGNSVVGLQDADTLIQCVAPLPAQGGQQGAAIPNMRFSFSTTTTVYFKMYQDSGGGAFPNMRGRISARRIR